MSNEAETAAAATEVHAADDANIDNVGGANEVK